MFCRNCGRELDAQAVACTGCGVPPLKGKKFCQNCGQPANEAAEICTSCGVRLAGSSAIGNINLPSANGIDVRQMVASYGKFVLLGIAFIVVITVMSTCGPVLWGIIPVSGLLWALIRVLNKPK